MNLDAARAALARGLEALAEVSAALVAEPATVIVRAGENLQAALDRGGALALDAGAEWEGTFALNSDTVLIGNGARIRGTTGPALVVPPGRERIAVSGLALRGSHTVMAIGVNTIGQARLEDVPDDVTLTNVHIPTHRGVRGFAIHGSHVRLIGCSVRDCYDPGEQDSQGVYIENTNGPVLIQGGSYSAGSEIILLGGDTTRIPNVRPVVLVDGVTAHRPLSEKTDGVYRKVKNCIEAKNGDLTVRKSVIDGCWAGSGQQGEAFVFTPDLDGGRRIPMVQSGQVTALVEDCTVANCGSLTNLRGRSYNSYTPAALTVTFRRVTAVLSRVQFGGRGQLATIGGEPDLVVFDNCDVQQDGSSLLYYDPGTVIDPQTKLSRLAGKIGRLAMTGCRSTLPAEYGIMLGGYTNAREWQRSVGELVVTGNVFVGPSSAMRAQLPENQYRVAL